MRQEICSWHRYRKRSEAPYVTCKYSGLHKSPSFCALYHLYFLWSHGLRGAVSAIILALPAQDPPQFARGLVGLAFP